MAPKKDNLPLTLDHDGDATSTITYANEVIAIIAGVAANEVEGVAGMSSTGGGFSDVFARNKNITKGVKVEIGTEEASVDLFLVVEYGTPIQTAALGVQENVRKAIESMTGLHVVRVDVHVQGVSFEKENKETMVGLESLGSSDINVDEVLKAVHQSKPELAEDSAEPQDDEQEPEQPQEPVEAEAAQEPDEQQNTQAE